jgi:hypothetical protein
MEKSPDRRTWKQTAAIWALALAWCWTCGFGIMVWICWGEVGMLSLPSSVEEWARRALAWFVFSAIATPIIGIFVRLAPPKRTAMIVLVGGAIPAIVIYGFAVLINGGYGR